MPKAEYHDRIEGKINLWEKLASRQPLSNAEMKQLFHAIDLQKHGAQTAQAKQEAEMLRQYTEDKLTRNKVDTAERDADGNVLLHGVPVRPEDAHYFARQDIQHFQNTDTHLKPSQMMALNKPNDTLDEPGAPDVTAETIFDIVSAGQLLRSLGKAAVSKLASEYLARQAAQRVISNTEQQLAKVYMRHGKDLGTIGNYSRANAQRLAEIIARHVRNPGTVMIKGTYRGTQKAIHYYNPHTHILVITYPTGELVSAWRISYKQLLCLLRTGNVQ